MQRNGLGGVCTAGYVVVRPSALRVFGCLGMLFLFTFLLFLCGVVVGVSADRQSAGECGAPFSDSFVHLRLEEKEKKHWEKKKSLHF